MLSRRNILKLGLVGLAACKSSPPSGGTKPAPAASGPPVESPRRSTVEGVDFVELFPNDANEASPIVLAMHGRGDDAESFSASWKDFPAKARIIVPRAVLRFGGGGWMWFESNPTMSDEQLGANIASADAKLWKALTAMIGTRKLIVTGFSQGGFMSFAMAASHPESVVASFPCSGTCPTSLMPEKGKPCAPIIAFHGIDDVVVPFAWGKGAVDGFKERGASAKLHSYRGVHHALAPEIRRDLWAEIQKAMPRAV